MVEFHLAPVSALGAAASVTLPDGYGLEEYPSMALASVAVRSGHGSVVSTMLEGILGTAPPGPGTFVDDGPFGAFWMSADQWMVFASRSEHDLLADDLKIRMKDTASITEQSDAFVCLDITGTDLSGAFEKLVMIDLDDFKVGNAARCVIDHVGCYILCLAERTRFRVLGPRSYAASLHHAVTTAIRAADAIARLR